MLGMRSRKTKGVKNQFPMGQGPSISYVQRHGSTLHFQHHTPSGRSGSKLKFSNADTARQHLHVETGGRASSTRFVPRTHYKATPRGKAVAGVAAVGVGLYGRHKYNQHKHRTQIDNVNPRFQGSGYY